MRFKKFMRDKVFHDKDKNKDFRFLNWRRYLPRRGKTITAGESDKNSFKLSDRPSSRYTSSTWDNRQHHAKTYVNSNQSGDDVLSLLK